MVFFGRGGGTWYAQREKLQVSSFKEVTIIMALWSVGKISPDREQQHCTAVLKVESLGSKGVLDFKGAKGSKEMDYQPDERQY